MIDQERSPSARLLAVPAPATLATAVAALVVLGAVVSVRPAPLDDQASAGTAASSPSPGPDVPDGPSAPMIRVPLLGAALWFAPPRPAGLWEVQLMDGLYISKNVVGPQGAEAMMLFTSAPAAEDVRPCLLDPASGSIDELADAVATAPGTELVSGPSPAPIGGRRAIHVSVTVAVPGWPEETGDPVDWTLGCDPGYFFGWEPKTGGAYWLETKPRDRIDAWIADVNGTLIFIQSMISGRLGALSTDLFEREIQGVVDSVRFEEP